MKTFQRNETVIYRARVVDNDGALVNPATSYKITITNPVGVVVVNAQNMVADSPAVEIDGVEYNHHYDYNPAADAVLGIYNIVDTAIDGTRTTKHTDQFILE